MSNVTQDVQIQTVTSDDDLSMTVELGFTVEDAIVEAKEAFNSSSSTITVTPAHVIPDGGLRAWSSVAGSFLICFCTFGYINAFGVYQTYYVDVLLLAYTPSDISWIGSLQIGLLFGMGIICGKLFDARYFRHMIVGGSVLYVGCIFAVSAVPTNAYYAAFLCQGIGQGVAQGLLYLPGMAHLSHHFRKRRALAMGIAITGSSLGGVVFPIMLNNIFQTSGFAAGVRATGYLILGCLGVANLLVSTNYDPNPPPKTGSKSSILTFLSDAPYVLTLIGSFFCLWGVLMIFFFIQLYAASHDISPSLSFYTISILNAASIFGRSIPNLIADKTGPFMLIVPWTIICAGLMFALLGVQSEDVLIVYCLLYGFFSGAVFSLYSFMIATLSPDMSEYGARLGLAFLVCGLGGLTGIPISGALIGANGSDYSWWKAILFCGTTVAVSAVLFGWAGLLQSRRKGTIWV